MQNNPQSYAQGSHDVPLLNDTIGQAFDNTVARFGDREALVSLHQDIRWTYAQLQQKVNDYAAAFVALELTPGIRIGIWAHNYAEWLVTQLASAKAGLILVNINPAYRRNELIYALNKVGCQALVLMPAHASSDYLAMMQSVAPELAECAPGELVCDAVPSLKTVIRLGDEPTPGMFNFDDLPNLVQPQHRERVKQLAPTLNADDPINIQFTSGTTGRPKGATLSHRNILNNGYFVGEAIALNEHDRLCIPVPLYHCFGMVMGNLGCLTHGSAMVYPTPAFNPAAVLAAVQSERCTALYGVPTMFIAELAEPTFAQSDLSSLRTGIMAGSICPMPVMQRVIDEMHMQDVTIAYGMTETSPVSCQTATGDSLEKRVSTVGRVQPHIDIKVVDEQNQTVPRGTAGELCTRGYSVMLGYWDDEEKTSEALDTDGWMHTGDIAQMDAEGYCQIVGRIKDMVIRGGENLYPREIEEYIYGHPAVEDVQVIGVPDDKYGEELCAWISLRSGDTATGEDIRSFCRNEIAHHKIPRYIRFVDEFPMTITGKVQKYKMRDVMIHYLEQARQETP